MILVSLTKPIVDSAGSDDECYGQVNDKDDEDDDDHDDDDHDDDDDDEGLERLDEDRKAIKDIFVMSFLSVTTNVIPHCH